MRCNASHQRCEACCARITCCARVSRPRTGVGRRSPGVLQEWRRPAVRRTARSEDLRRAAACDKQRGSQPDVFQFSFCPRTRSTKVELEISRVPNRSWNLSAIRRTHVRSYCGFISSASRTLLANSMSLRLLLFAISSALSGGMQNPLLTQRSKSKYVISRSIGGVSLSSFNPMRPPAGGMACTILLLCSSSSAL